VIRSGINTILLSRVDNLGDAVLLLPAAGILKAHYPTSRILFLGQTYQQVIIESSRHFDGFLDWEEVSQAPVRQQAEFLSQYNIDVIVHVKPRHAVATAAKRANIPHRVGAADRLFHLLTCNHLPYQVRRWSQLHEAQLNIRLLKPLLRKVDYALDELEPYLGFDRIKPYRGLAERYLSRERFNLILHPKSLGHAKEWNVSNFAALIQRLPYEQYNILVTGTRKEGEALHQNLLGPLGDHLHNLTGQLTLSELVSLISRADGLIAASTGPLHIAAAAGIYALGLYVQKRPLYPGRYGPIGEHARAMVYDENCPVCLADKDCDCINKISPERVLSEIVHWQKLH
jgi:heptosyltransferase-3